MISRWHQGISAASRPYHHYAASLCFGDVVVLSAFTCPSYANPQCIPRSSPRCQHNACLGLDYVYWPDITVDNAQGTSVHIAIRWPRPTKSSLHPTLHFQTIPSKWSAVTVLLSMTKIMLSWIGIWNGIWCIAQNLETLLDIEIQTLFFS